MINVKLEFKNPDQMNSFFTYLVNKYGNIPFRKIKDLNAQHSDFCQTYNAFYNGLEKTIN
tara:strand:- start:662 stop:841 length:180 start_codon:yes stop_codon:yes gene_type:complete